MDKIMNKVLKLKPGTLAIIFLLLPFVTYMVTGIITIISLFANFEFIFPLILIGISTGVVLFFIWVWGVIYYIDKKDNPATLYFKISYWILFSYFIIMFTINLDMDFTHKQILLENSTWVAIDIASSLYHLIVFISYIYLCYFAGKKISLIQKSNSDFEFFYIAAIWCFPIGIPLLQTKLLNQKTMFDRFSR
ncbi:MAG: hypothetical protein ABI441_11915 [Flavobacterium sp.]